MKNKLYTFLFTAALLLPVLNINAAELSPIEWNHKGTTFTGFYAAGEKSKPGIVIFHQWLGVSTHEKEIASELNKLGYTVLAADLYGKGNIPANRDDAKKIAGTFYADREKFRSHVSEALKALSKKSGKSSKNIYAIGYCFGGTAALELARTGTQLAGFVSLHGGLANPAPGDDAKIKGKILILHGAEDQSVPMTDVNLLIESLKKQKKDFSVHIFADAVHGFTHKHDQVRYNKKADERSWKIMLDFFKE
ncbi:MAG TPA: dienelactone hydrolase family protein [Spirochaetota bacterium]|nr:dienelactone hydrolase family protein [Spirochaetota bacterium]